MNEVPHVYAFVTAKGEVMGFKLENREMGAVREREPLLRPANVEEGVLPYFARELRFMSIWRSAAAEYAEINQMPVRLIMLTETAVVERYAP